MKNDLQNQMENLEKGLQLRTAQISDMQSKIVDDDFEIANKKRFDSVLTMAESKYAMQYLFKVASEKLCEVCEVECMGCSPGDEPQTRYIIYIYMWRGWRGIGSPRGSM